MARLVLVLIIFLAIIASISAGAFETETAGRKVDMTFVIADSLAPFNWPQGEVSLGSALEKITAERDIYTLLQANGLVPDTEALTILYDLNPNLLDASSLPVGYTLQVPKIDGGQEVHDLLGSGRLVLLTVDPELRNELRQTASTLQDVCARFSSSSGEEAFKTQIDTLARWYAEIQKAFYRRTGPPLRRETLLQMNAEALSLIQVLQRIERAGDRPTAYEEKQVAAIYEDLEREMRRYGQSLGAAPAKAERRYDILVNIKGGGPSLTDTLRVYYTYNGIYQDPPVDPPVKSYAFKGLGSGKSERLLLKNYRFWAARDGDSAHPVTPPVLVELVPPGDNSPIVVELSLPPHTP
jgi:hypothetical protein